MIRQPLISDIQLTDIELIEAVGDPDPSFLEIISGYRSGLFL
jgi:hypothetical protein